MSDDDERSDVRSDPGTEPPGEREHAIRQVAERIAAAAAAAQRAAQQAAQQAARPVSGERPVCQPARDAPPPSRSGPTLRSPPSHPAWVARPADPEQPPAPVNLAPPASRGPAALAPAVVKSTVPMPALSPEALATASAAPVRPAPAQPPPQRRPAPPTVQSRAAGIGETTPVGDDSIEQAVAAIRSPLSLPPLTLRRFASLCAELAFKPTWRREILKRYGVLDEAVLTALDAYWRRERAERPEARTAFADDYAIYLAWLHVHWT